MATSSSLVNVERLLAMSSGEMYQEIGIRSRRSVTRSVEYKSSFRSAGNEMPCRSSDRRLGANPPRKESGSTEHPSLSSDSEESCKDVSAVNATFNAVDLFNSEFGTPQRLISRTRRGHWSAAMTFRTPRGRSLGLVWYETTIGNSGQISSISLTGVLFVQ